MKKNFGPKAWLYPMPVLIIGSYDENGIADAMNAAWGGISLEDRISICVDDAHKTTANGKVDVARLAPIVFDPVNHVYHRLGEAVGAAFKAGLALSTRA